MSLGLNELNKVLLVLWNILIIISGQGKFEVNLFNFGVNMMTHNMGIFSMLLAICEVNPPWWIHLTKGQYHGALIFLCWMPEQAVKLPVILDAMMLMWHPCNWHSASLDAMAATGIMITMLRSCKRTNLAIDWLILWKVIYYHPVTWDVANLLCDE